MTRMKLWIGALGLAAALGTAAAHAQTAYPTMAPVADYLMADQAREIALSRTAAPPSVSADASVMVLGRKGYVTAVKGKNGFVCLLQRAWFSGLEDKGFWNPKLLAPICFNPEAARSVLPIYLTRTDWAMAGVSQAEMLKRTRASLAAGKLQVPAIGAITYMLSKDGYLGDVPHGPWHPHLMFFMPRTLRTADWGADLAGTQVYGGEAGADPWTMFFVPVANWSDGTPDAHPPGPHKM